MCVPSGVKANTNLCKKLSSAYLMAVLQKSPFSRRMWAQAMATTCYGIYFGTSSKQLDPAEGNSNNEGYALFQNTTWGSSAGPRFSNNVQITAGNFSGGADADAVKTNNNIENATLSTNIGGTAFTSVYDGTSIYNAILTYADGTTATVAAYDDGYIDGSTGDDLIGSTYVEPIASGSDKGDNSDAGLAESSDNDDYIRAGAGDDTVRAGAGNDRLDGGAGNDALYGEPEVLAPALHLIRMPGITRATPGWISYFHILFDEHQRVCADGDGSESLQPVQYTLAGLKRAQRPAICALFPDLSAGVPDPAARMMLKPKEAHMLLHR